MRKTLLGITFIALSASVIACNQHADHAVVKEGHEHVTIHPDSLTLKLNNGDRWVVNEEMKPFVMEAEAALAGFSMSDSSDYKLLASKLDELNMGLIKSCTMKGESHDELHKWLAPHMEAITALGEANSSDEAKLLVDRLKESFGTYHQHFQ